jgi:hypothetical protein
MVVSGTEKKSPIAESSDAEIASARHPPVNSANMSITATGDDTAARGPPASTIAAPHATTPTSTPRKPARAISDFTDIHFTTTSQQWPA